MALTPSQQSVLQALALVTDQVKSAIEDDRVLDVVIETDADGTTTYSIVVAKP